MDIQEIELYIAPDGTVKIHVNGVKGMACLELTKELEEALGGKIVSREMTPEARESGSATTTDHTQARG